MSKLSIRESLIKKVRFRPTQIDDFEGYYKGYLLGVFGETFPEGLSKGEFFDSFQTYVITNQLSTVTFFGFKDDVELPVGVSFFWARERILQMADMLWFPWASSRTVYECSLSFFDGVRKTTYKDTEATYKILEFAREEDEKFFDKLVDLKILSKVGKIDGLYTNNKKATLYVTREVED